MTTTHADHTTSTRRREPTASRLSVSPLAGGRAAIAYGVLAMVIGAAQAARTGDTSVQIATGMRWILVGFALSLLVVVPAHLALGAFARSERRAARSTARTSPGSRSSPSSRTPCG
jgi:hypothetical protein